MTGGRVRSITRRSGEGRGLGTSSSSVFLFRRIDSDYRPIQGEQDTEFLRYGRGWGVSDWRMTLSLLNPSGAGILAGLVGVLISVDAGGMLGR
jgi:hypothetical protein